MCIEDHAFSTPFQRKARRHHFGIMKVVEIGPELKAQFFHTFRRSEHTVDASA